MTTWQALFYWHRQASEQVGLPEFEAESAQTVQKIESAGRQIERAVKSAMAAVASQPDRTDG